MDPAQRERVLDDLKGIVAGELLFDELSRALYATDASLFEVEPGGIVLPRDEQDLSSLIRYAAENQVSLTSRGAGTGMAGESLGSDLVVDLTTHFNRILALDSDTVTVQPGVTLHQLNTALAPLGRRLGPDPDNLEATIGGMLATNASGPRACRLGTMREQVLALRMVLDSGDVVNIDRSTPWPRPTYTPGRLEDILSATVTLLEQNRDLLLTNPSPVPFNRCGYFLDGILQQDALDLTGLLVGSEGTLGIFTAATLRTLPLPGGQAMVMLGFARMDTALRAARLAITTAPSMCELLDRRLLRLARGESNVAELIPDGAEAVLVIEYEADSPTAAQALARELTSWLTRRERLAIMAQTAFEPTDRARLIQLRRAVLPGLFSLRSGAKPVSIVEDVAVPPDKLPLYLPRLQDILRRQEMTAAFLIRPMTGQIQMRPFLDLQNARDANRLWSLADEVYSLVLDIGGTISAQHGTGLSRMPWLGRQMGPLVPVHREVKAIFDPQFLFNPGKIVAPPSQPITWPFRRRIGHPPAASETKERGSATELIWSHTGLAEETLTCNGCGECRHSPSSQGPTSPERMCPIFRAYPVEAATPRAKANLMRHLLHPDTDPALLSSDKVREVAELCVNCKMCVRECPSRVQIPKLMLEAKAANVAQHGLNRNDWALARTESFAWLGSAIAPLANALLANPFSRWLLERIFGVSRLRRLPKFATRSFMQLARQRGWTRKPRSARPRVAFFVDVFANYNDPLIAEAVVEVLHHNGVEVYVPPGQIGCGMAPLSYGDVETAREVVQHNLRILADLAREGFPILCAEPSAALMLRHDALDLLDDLDAQIVAAQTVEFTAFLWDLHQQGLLRTDFHPLELPVGHHVPCHIKALGRDAVGPDLLKLVPGMRVGIIDVSCSGMAGTFGFKSERYELSLAAGRPMLDELDRPRYLYGSTECSACRLQMEDGTGKRTLHPAQYLALAYGLMPELQARLREPIGKWVLQ